MKLKDILLKAGPAAVKSIFPAAGAVIDAVNLFLPDDKKLDNSASGKEVNSALSLIPEDQRAVILDKEFDLKKTMTVESHSSVRAMLHAEANSKQTTRPKIAYEAFLVYSASTFIILGLLSYAIAQSIDPLKEIKDSAWIIISILGPYATIVLAYFGVLKEEHKNRLNAANGLEAVGGLFGMLGKRK